MDLLALAAELGDGLTAALRFPLDPDKRVYGVYLLGALVLASAVYCWQARAERSWRGWARTLFSPRVWWHPSARLDYLLAAVNPLFRLLAGGAAIAVVPVALAVSEGLEGWFGNADPVWPGWAVTAAFTVALFVADDFTRYLLHRALHRVPALWALHRLHHSAEVLTPVTVYRIHPLESALYSTRMVLTQGAVIGLFFYGFGMRLGAWDIAGANALTYLFNAGGANLRHSHIWLSYGPWLERLFISPAQHQIHHSDRPEHFDRNFGSFLAVWDYAFGSLTLARGQRVTGFGLGSADGQPHSSLWRAYALPLREALMALLPRRRPSRNGARPESGPVV